jgi:hypothetical protein
MIEAKCQQNTNRKLGLRFRRKIFSRLGGASVVPELNLCKLLKNGKIYAKLVNRPLIGSRGLAFK